MRFQAILSLVVLIALVGCATRAQQRADEINARLKTLDSQQRACFAEVLSTPAALRLADNFNLDPDKTIDIKNMLIDRSATPEEKEDLTTVNSDDQRCQKLTLEGFAGVHPLFVSRVAQALSAHDRIFVDLMRDKITVGEFNEGLKKIRTDWLSQANEVMAEVNKELTSMHENQLRDRAEAARAIRQFNYQQQILNSQQEILNSLNQPSYTSCRYVGYSLSCTTY